MLAWLSKIRIAVMLAAFLSPAALGDDIVALARLGPHFKRLCTNCHSNAHAEAKVNLDTLVDDFNIARDFRKWRRIKTALRDQQMPPSDADQPTALERKQLVEAIELAIAATAKRYANDPGPMVMRRLTSAEYGYSIRDLTGLDLQLERDFVSDAVGGEGFANVGTVQFMQDSTLERFLDAAKTISTHAVIGTGPVTWSADPGQSGYELSAIRRIQDIYRQYGFRSGAGEGGEAFGLTLYPRAFFVAWQFKHREKLGQPSTTLEEFALREGVTSRFAKYIWRVLQTKKATFPLSTIVAKWTNIRTPSSNKNAELKLARSECEEVYKLVEAWQTRLGQNPDAKEEAPVLRADDFDVTTTKPFIMGINWPEGTKIAHLEINIDSAYSTESPKVLIAWESPRIQFRIPQKVLADPVPLRSVLPKSTSKKLGFGRHPLQPGSLSPTDFATLGVGKISFEIPIPEGATSARLFVNPRLDPELGESAIVRCTIRQQEETDQGKQVSALLANSNAEGFEAWKKGVLDFARVLPQVSHREPAPSDRDPIPRPFDSSYNNSERNAFHYQIKYYRNDQFLVQNILDDATRTRLDQAWMDLFDSFEYHDTFLRFVVKKLKLPLKDPNISTLRQADIERLSGEGHELVSQLLANFKMIQRAKLLIENTHKRDVERLAAAAWRRPVKPTEVTRLRQLYDSIRSLDGRSHADAIRAAIASVFVSPSFLYRAEPPNLRAEDVEGFPRTITKTPLTDWELASRLSYFLWSSVPDEKLLEAARNGQLQDAAVLAKQARRMLKDPKARRFATEFFGQWFGFYRFDEFKGIDPDRFPEFDRDLKQDLYAEAITFFEHIVRKNQPVDDILFADYGFLNQRLANHYSLPWAKSQDEQALKLVPNISSGHRGGLLGLAAVLTPTSAPRRTSPVKRGDWILRRVLSTPVPPPPPDAGSIPADDVVDDGLSVRARLAAHRRNATCNSCHSRIDPLGFALENFDALGRWRSKYRDGQPIENSTKLKDGRTIDGVAGLRKYLKSHKAQFHRTLCTKLCGYAFGRSESISDVQLIGEMMHQIQENGAFHHLIHKVVTSRQFRFRRH